MGQQYDKPKKQRERSIKEWPSLAAGLLYSGMGNKKRSWGGVGRVGREVKAPSFLPNALVSCEHLCLFDFYKFIL